MNASKGGAIVRVADQSGHRVWVASSQPQFTLISDRFVPDPVPTTLRGPAKCSQKNTSLNNTEKTMRCVKVRDAIHAV